MHAVAVVSLLALSFVPAPAPASFDRSTHPNAPHAPASELPCVGFWAEAKYAGLGYNHIVHLVSECKFKASCTVATNVNPEPQTISLPAGARLDVITFIGSPASVFTALVQCTRAPISVRGR